MGDLFRSAMSYLSSGIDSVGSAATSAGGAAGAGGVGGTSPGGGSTDHSLVGQTVEVGGLKLRIRTLIAEGGFALVFSATDHDGNWYALKRLLAADREQSESILKEIRFLRLLTGHPSIIRYVQAASLSPQESGHGRAEFLLLTELCSGGPVITALQAHTFDPDHVLRIFHATTAAVKHMHAQTPPITHRDLKIENLLLDTQGFVKLCDFGSAMTESYVVDSSWSAAGRSRVEDEMTRNTTPMYRSPEMIDLYLDYPIGPPLDVWALGCILFYLCYRVHPFEDSAKLRILNAKYTLPEKETPFTVFHPLIESCLRIDPRERPTVADLLASVEAIAVVLECDLRRPLTDLLPPRVAAAAVKQHTASTASPRRPPPPTASSSSGGGAPSRPPPPSAQHHAPPARPPPPAATMTQQQSSGALSSASAASGGSSGGAAESSGAAFFGSLKGQAGSLFKNIKDNSAKVVQSVQVGMGGRGPDVYYVTSRLAVAPMHVDGLPEAIAGAQEDALRACLQQRHPNAYAIYNLNQRRLRGDYGGRVSEVGASVGLGAGEHGRPPSLHTVFLVCRNMTLWLRQRPTNLCVVTGDDVACVTVAAAALVYCRLVPRPLAAVELSVAKRQSTNAVPITFPPSTHRYLDYVHGVAQQKLSLHNRAITITAVRLEPIPLFNRARTGCRPFAEVWQANERILTTSQEYENIRPYEAVPGGSRTIDIPLGVSVLGDCSLVVFHARSTLGAKVQGRMTSMPILRINFHTGAIDPSSSFIDFTYGDLDDVAPVEERWKYPEPFRVTMAVRVADQNRPFASEPPAYWHYDSAAVSPRLLVSDKHEKALIQQQFGIQPSRQSPAGSVSPTRSASPTPAVADPTEAAEESKEGNFLDSLAWGRDEAKAKNGAGDVDRRSPKERQPSPHLIENTTDERAAAAAKGTPSVKDGLDTAEAYERMYGIRVNATDDAEAAMMVPDEPHPEPVPPEPGRPQQEADLLNLGGSATDSLSGVSSGSAAPPPPPHQVHDILSADPFDPFAQFEQQQRTTTNAAPSEGGVDAFFADFGQLGVGDTTSAATNGLSMKLGTPGYAVGTDAEGDDLLQDWGDTILRSSANNTPTMLSRQQHLAPAASGLPRNVSAPAFAANPPAPPPPDPFAGLSADFAQRRPTTPQPSAARQRPTGGGLSPSPSASKLSGAAGGLIPPPPSQTPMMRNSQSATPLTAAPSRPNYSRSAFDAAGVTSSASSTGGVKPRVAASAFGDILSSQGFAATGGGAQGPRTIGELQRKTEIEGMEPLQIKIRDWIKGKERNIRALLGSMHEVVWPEASSRWEPVAMSQLLSAAQVKKYYRKACLVVHPDKQTGTENEALARAIFTELNDAWNDFEQAGEPSL